MRLLQGFFLVFFILLLGGFGYVLGYEGVGFTNFSLQKDGISFTCQSTCIIPLEGLSRYDSLDISGKVLQGNGNYGYGVIQSDRIIPIKVKEISENINHSFSISSDQKAVLFFSAKNVLTVDSLSLSEKRSSTLQKFVQKRKVFMKVEGLTPYSINLRYGSFWGTMSLTRLAYNIFFIFAVLLVLYKMVRKDISYTKTLLQIAIILFLLVGARNLIDYVHISNEKTMFDAYYTFTQEARDKLNLSEIETTCTYYAEALQDWPYIAWWKSVYMSPCTFTDKIQDANYALFYQKKPSLPLDDFKLIYEDQGSSLYQRNKN